MAKHKKEHFQDIHKEYKKQLMGFEYQERALLGTLLASKEATRKALVEHHITKNHFFFAHTRAFFRAIESVFNSGFPFTKVSILEELINSGQIYETDGLIEVGDLQKTSFTAKRMGLSFEELCELLTTNKEFRSCYFLVTRYDPPDESPADGVYYY
jgi:hypothetical protein